MSNRLYQAYVDNAGPSPVDQRRKKQPKPLTEWELARDRAVALASRRTRKNFASKHRGPSNRY